MTYFAKIFQTSNADIKPEKKEKAKPKSIPKESAKRKAENAKYKKIAATYLSLHPLCEVKLKGCTKKSIEVHHDKGRGIRLNDVSTFVAICRNCHNIVENQNIKVHD